jgi:hypothetical protein
VAMQLSRVLNKWNKRKHDKKIKWCSGKTNLPLPEDNDKCWDEAKKMADEIRAGNRIYLNNKSANG